MPKQTFFNLTEEKRGKIIRAGLDEFAEKGYKLASINNIVTDAGIPKGSFYQYFDDKKDMFKHICELAIKEKFSYMEGFIYELDRMDFFEAYKKMYSAGIQFGMDHPEYFCISNSLLNEPGLRAEIYGQQLGKVDSFYEGFLGEGIRRGQIREDIDKGLVIKMLTSLSVALGEYFLEKHGWSNLNKLEDYSDQFIDIIKNGLARR